MAAFGIRASALANNGQTAASTSCNFTVPAGAMAGDLMVAAFSLNGAAQSINSVASGWTALSSLNAAGTTMRASVYYKIAPGGIGSTSTDAGNAANFGLSGSIKSCGVMAVLYGSNFSRIFDTNTVAGSATSGATLTAPAITTRWPETFILEFFMGHTTTTVNTAGTLSANITAINFASTNFAGAVNLSAEACYKTTTATPDGTFGSDTTTHTNSDNARVTYSIAILPELHTLSAVGVGG